MSVAAFKLQQRRRDQERILHGTQSFLSQHQNTEIRHDFEARTQKQIEQREVNAITDKLLQQDEEELLQRKKELSSLYDGEMSQWKKTLQSSLEVTQEERMERIRTRAYELKAKREAEREAFVKECYERQWRDACDDLRAYDSKATLDRIVKDRESMIRSKRNSEANNQDESEDMSLIHKDESDEQSQRRQANLEFKRALDHQVEWKRSQAESMMRQKQIEEQEKLRELAVLEQKAQATAKASIDKARRNGDDLLQETRMRARERNDRQEMERKQNLILLQHALENEKKQIKAEQAKKEGGKEAASEYVQCLRQQKQLEEKENELLNDIRTAELERLSKIRDDKTTAKKAAARRWMEEVDTSRQAQIRRQRREEEALRKELDQDAAELKASLLRAEEADKRDAEKAQELRMENMKYNRERIDRRSKERQREEQEKYLLQKQIQNNQREYQKRLEEQRKGCGVDALI